MVEMRWFVVASSLSTIYVLGLGAFGFLRMDGDGFRQPWKVQIRLESRSPEPWS